MKVNIISKCNEQSVNGGCLKCPLRDYPSCCYMFEDDNDVKEKYLKMIKADNINHPSHYNREGAMECIDEMTLVFGVEAVKNFCLCNWLKYRYRANSKGGEEDLKKSDFYIKKYKELCND